MKEREKKGKLGREILSLQQRFKVCRRPIRSSGAKITLQKNSPFGGNKSVLASLTYAVTGWKQSVGNVDLA